jgi:mgtE-like transporter
MAESEHAERMLLPSATYQSLLVATPEKDNINATSSFGNIPRIIKQSFFALFICAAADIFAGFSIARMAYILPLYPGLVILIPGVIGMRGSIFGSFGARLGTSFHTGEVSPPFSRSMTLRQQIGGVAAQTLATSLVLALVVKGLGMASGLETMGIHNLILISILSGLVSGAVLLGFTLLMISQSFRKGWDPDNISVPLITATGDVITIPILFASAIAVSTLNSPEVLYLSLGLIALTLAASIYSISAGYPLLARIVRQSLPILMICALICSIAGIFMGMELDILIAYTAVLLLIPVFNAEGGNLGGILSSRLSSAYHLGLTKMSRRPDKLTEKNFSSILLLSLLIFPVLGILAHLVSSLFGFSSPGFWDILLICVTAGLSTTLLAIAITYYLTYFSVKIGIDPDNVVIPTITSVMDVLGTGCLILVTIVVI